MSNIINVAIVLIAIFIGLAVICSFIQEQIAWLLKQRGKKLYEGILNLVACHEKLANSIWDSSLVKAGKDAPSYVDARNFSLSLWQNVHTVLGKTEDDKKAALDVNAPKDALQSVITRITAFEPSAPVPIPTNAAPADKAAAVAKNAVATGELDLKKTLVSLLNAAENDYDKLLVVTDQWFDAQMDRVSGWYKRWAQWCLIGIAFVVVMVGGVDTLDLAKQLYTSSATQAAADDIRATVVQHQNDPDKNKAAAAIAATLDKQLKGKLNLHVFHPIWHDPGYDKPATFTSTTADAAAAAATDPYVEPTRWWHLLGVLLTFIAVSLGAPFWFDLLKCIINVRMAGTRPDDVPAPTKQPTPPGPTVVVNNVPAATT